jgi:hypothetical protein
MKRSNTTALRIVHGEIVSSARTTSSAGAASARTDQRGRTVHTASPSGSSSTSAFARVRHVRPASTPAITTQRQRCVERRCWIAAASAPSSSSANSGSDITAPPTRISGM